jgi:predicted transcriptional regulator
MEGLTYRVRIVRGTEEFEAEGDKQFVLDMLERFSVPPAFKEEGQKVGLAREEPAQREKPLSPGEFVRQIGFKKHTDLVLGFAYYLDKYSGVTEFTAADINNLYYEAKLESSNTSQMIINNIRRGYMMEAKTQEPKGKKVYTLTRSGEEFVEEALRGRMSPG